MLLFLPCPEEVIVPYQEEVYEDYFKELYQSRYSPGNYEEDMELYRQKPEHGYFAPRFISVDEKGFEAEINCCLSSSSVVSFLNWIS